MASTVVINTIKHNMVLLQQGTALMEPRLVSRAARSLHALKPRLAEHATVVAEFISAHAALFSSAGLRDAVLAGLKSLDSDAAGDAVMDDAAPAAVDAPDAPDAVEPPTIGSALLDKAGDIAALQPLPEVDVYLALVTLAALLVRGQYAAVKAVATAAIISVDLANRRTLDALASKVYFYWVRAYELAHEDTSVLLPQLLAAQRTAALRHDDDLQATLLPLILRIYLQHNLYEQADRLAARATFPQATAANAQVARWWYYLGRIRAVQLNYSEAHAHLQQAIRRAPDAATAPGFRVATAKLSVVVELLMGEIPDRSIFRHPVLGGPLRPYFEVVQAVRTGDLTAFTASLEKHAATFARDQNRLLVSRLHHNVIQTALRTISLAYSNIYLHDIATTLKLESEEDAEYIVSKAIRDGIVRAEIDHKNGIMKCKDVEDLYATGEPQKAFDERVRFLLELRDESVKSMRYAVNPHAKELASIEEARERERELAKELEGGEEENDMDDFLG